jgi:hypothetical protein
LKFIRRNSVICLFFFSLIIPTSSFASDNNNSYYDENLILSFFVNLFDGFFGEKSYANNDEDKYLKYDKGYDDKEWHYIGGKKINKKDWEKHLKKKYPPKGEIESKHIWKKWYCYDDDWDDDDWDDDDWEDWDQKWWDWFH